MKLARAPVFLWIAVGAALTAVTAWIGWSAYDGRQGF